MTAAVRITLQLATLAEVAEYHAELKLPGPSWRNVGPHWTPRQLAEDEGAFASNAILQKAEILFKDQILGSESVAVNRNGDLYMLDRYGVVWRSSTGKGKPQRLARLTAGRPLGFHFDHSGNLVICNAASGLQLLEKDTHRLISLVTEAPVSHSDLRLTPLRFTNDVSVASDGAIYFSESTDIPPTLNEAGFYDTMSTFVLNLLQGEKSGRLLKYDPKQGSTSLLLSGLHFANGVALSPKGDFVLVVESSSVRVTRLWLKGPKAGQQETFIDQLPGYPDGISEGSDGTFWLALASLKNPALELLVRSRITRWLLPRLPASFSKTQLGTAVVQLSAEGKVLRYLDDPDGAHISTVTAVTETPDGLYFGNLGGNFVSFLRSADLPSRL